MACFNPEAIWALHQDQYGRVYWRNRITSEIRWDNLTLVGQQGFVTPPPPFVVGFGQHTPVGLPNGVLPPFGQPVGAHVPVAVARPAGIDQPLGLRPGLHPNIVQPFDVSPSLEAIAKAWEEHFDKPSERKYWYNTLTKESTWEDPKGETSKPPPPPPPPSPSPVIPPTKFKKREQDLWFKVDDGKGRKLWFNEKTGEKQYGVPDCRKKYR